MFRLTPEAKLRGVLKVRLYFNVKQDMDVVVSINTLVINITDYNWQRQITLNVTSNRNVTESLRYIGEYSDYNPCDEECSFLDCIHLLNGTLT